MDKPLSLIESLMSRKANEFSGLSSSHKREWSTTPSCGKTKDPGNEVVNA